jgi:hypothetical protein
MTDDAVFEKYSEGKTADLSEGVFAPLEKPWDTSTSIS